MPVDIENNGHLKYVHNGSQLQSVLTALRRPTFYTVRPGKEETSPVRYTGAVPIEFRKVRYFCQACGADNPHMCMIHDFLWQQIAPLDGLMCILCMEERMGRPLTVDDLKDDEKCNREIRHLLQRAVK